MNLHEADFYTWTQQQAALLRAGNLGALDVANLIDEIEDMGRAEKRELSSRLAVLIAHLLKWHYQPSHRGRSWRCTIKEQRIRLTQCLRDNSGLKATRHTAMIDAYEIAMYQAMRETKLDESVFPTTCSWTFEQVIDDEFWPN